jgi:hypothetical protein
MKCLNCPLTYIGQTGRTLTFRYKNTSTASETTTAIPDIQTICKHNNRHRGGHRDRKEGQTFEYLGKISHL